MSDDPGIRQAPYTSPDPVDIQIGLNVRNRRKLLGLSQTALADTIGVTFQQVQKYERGANRISGSKLVQIASTLDTSVGALVDSIISNRDASARDQHLALIGGPEAIELLTGFAAINSAGQRRAILDLVKECGAGAN